MYNNDKTRKIITLFLMPIFLAFISSCAHPLGHDVTSMEAYERAVEAGIILPIEELEGTERSRNLVPVQVGQIYARGSVTIRFDMDQVRFLSFGQGDVRLLEIVASLNQEVAKGDVLAVASFDTRELEEEIEVLTLTIEMGELDFRLGWDQHQNLLHEMRVALDLMTEDHQRRTQNYRISRQELMVRNFSSEYEQRLEAYGEQLAQLRERVEGEKIVAPFDGVIVWVTEDEVDTIMERGDLVVGIIGPDRFQLRVEERIQLIRYGDVFPVRMQRYNLEFDVEVVSDPIATGTREDEYTFILQPEDREWFWESIYDLGIGYSALDLVRFEGYPTIVLLHNVLVVPREAINVHDFEFYVWLYEDGEYKVRFVEIGLTDRNYVQILSGLTEGQLVVR